RCAWRWKLRVASNTRYEHGVAFVDPAPLSDPGLVPRAAALASWSRRAEKPAGAAGAPGRAWCARGAPRDRQLRACAGRECRAVGWSRAELPTGPHPGDEPRGNALARRNDLAGADAALRRGQSSVHPRQIGFV